MLTAYKIARTIRAHYREAECSMPDERHMACLFGFAECFACAYVTANPTIRWVRRINHYMYF